VAANPIYYQGLPQQGPPPPPEPERPRDNPNARQALLETIFALDQAKKELENALRGPVIDTCGVYMQRAATQMGYARNNLIRASACLATPAEMRQHVNFRNIPSRGFPTGASVVSGRTRY